MPDDVVGNAGQVLRRVLLGLLWIGARSWYVTCHLVVRVEGDPVWLVMFMRYSRAGAWLRVPASTQHRRLAPGLLQGARRILVRIAGR